MLFPEFNTPANAVHARMAALLSKDLPNNYRISLTGAQRTGKTTMAKAYADTMGIPFIDASVSKILATHGLDSSATYSDDFGKRLTAQRKLLESLDIMWDNAQGGFITDRSPLCMAMYTLADITGTSTVTNEQYRELIQYVNDCKAVTVKQFNTVVLVPLNPKIELVSTAKSATANPAFIHHLYTVISDLFNDIPRRTDAAPELDDAQGVVEKYMTRPEHGQGLTDVLGNFDSLGKVTNLLFDVFATESMPLLSSMTLPHSALSVKDRVEWLRTQQQFKTIKWLNRALNEVHESPMLSSEFDAIADHHFEDAIDPLYEI